MCLEVVKNIFFSKFFSGYSSRCWKKIEQFCLLCLGKTCRADSPSHKDSKIYKLYWGDTLIFREGRVENTRKMNQKQGISLLLTLENWKF